MPFLQAFHTPSFHGRPTLRHFRSLPHFVIPAVFWAGIQSVCIRASFMDPRQLHSGMTGKGRHSPELPHSVISEVCWAGIQSFLLHGIPKVRQSVVKQSILSASGPASWIPEYYLGDDGKRCRHSRSLLGGNPVYILWAGHFLWNRPLLFTKKP